MPNFLHTILSPGEKIAVWSCQRNLPTAPGSFVLNAGNVALPSSPVGLVSQNSDCQLLMVPEHVPPGNYTLMSPVGDASVTVVGRPSRSIKNFEPQGFVPISAQLTTAMAQGCDVYLYPGDYFLDQTSLIADGATIFGYGARLIRGVDANAGIFNRAFTSTGGSATIKGITLVGVGDAFPSILHGNDPLQNVELIDVTFVRASGPMIPAASIWLQRPIFQDSWIQCSGGPTALLGAKFTGSTGCQAEFKFLATGIIVDLTMRQTARGVCFNGADSVYGSGWEIAEGRYYPNTGEAIVCGDGTAVGLTNSLLSCVKIRNMQGRALAVGGTTTGNILDRWDVQSNGGISGPFDSPSSFDKNTLSNWEMRDVQTVNFAGAGSNVLTNFNVVSLSKSRANEWDRLPNPASCVNFTGQIPGPTGFSSSAG
jgi:hypothetical protein